MKADTGVEAVHRRLGWLFKASSLAALILGGLLLAGLAAETARALQSSLISSRSAPVWENWLLKILCWNAGCEGAAFDHLYGVYPLDLLLLALAGGMHLGLYAALRSTSRVWPLVAAVMPWLGIVVFIASQIAGRSGLMGAALVVSLVMLRSRYFGKPTALQGITGSVLLLAGDFGTRAEAHSTLVAVLVGGGYLLLATWFLVVGAHLWRLGRLTGPARV